MDWPTVASIGIIVPCVTLIVIVKIAASSPKKPDKHDQTN